MWDDVWEQLVDEGIVEALCTSTPELETLGDACIGHQLPLDEGDRAYVERVSSAVYYFAENGILIRSPFSLRPHTYFPFEFWLQGHAISRSMESHLRVVRKDFSPL